MFIAIGIAVVITQVISVSKLQFHYLNLAYKNYEMFQSVMFSIVSENLSIRFRVRSFHNILHQDAAFFDNPVHSPGKIITRLAVDAPNIKAVRDFRFFKLFYNLMKILLYSKYPKFSIIYD